MSDSSWEFLKTKNEQIKTAQKKLLSIKNGMKLQNYVLKQWTVNDKLRGNLVAWYKFAFAVWLNRDAYSTVPITIYVKGSVMQKGRRVLRSFYGRAAIYLTQPDDFLRCDPNYSGPRCDNCTNCECPADQIQCKIGKWFCATKTDVCQNGVDCGLSPADFVKICQGEWCLLPARELKQEQRRRLRKRSWVKVPWAYKLKWFLVYFAFFY